MDNADTAMSQVLENIKNLTADLEKSHDYIEAAIEYTGGTHTFDDVAFMILQGRFRLWALPHSAMVTEIIEYPREKHYHVFLAGGDLTEITACQDDLIAAAKEAGCSKLTLAGRRGWLRALTPLGWKEQYTACAKEIE